MAGCNWHLAKSHRSWDSFVQNINHTVQLDIFLEIFYCEIFLEEMLSGGMNCQHEFWWAARSILSKYPHCHPVFWLYPPISVAGIPDTLESRNIWKMWTILCEAGSRDRTIPRRLLPTVSLRRQRLGNRPDWACSLSPVTWDPFFLREGLSLSFSNCPRLPRSPPCDFLWTKNRNSGC